MADLALVVDDSLTVRMDLCEAFSAAGFRTTGCGSASETRTAVATETPDVIVLDIVLPDGDGVDLMVELRERIGTRAPVLLLSTEAEVRDRLRGLKNGADAYVGKPYEAEHVVARATALLARERNGTGASLRVLVVDDSVTYRQALGELLRGAGYEVHLAGSGEEGLRRAVDLRPGMIVVDGVMPGMDGPGLVRRVRLDPSLAATACVLLTGSDDTATEVAALDAGADAYVRKSDGPDLVLTRVAAVLRAAEESRGAPHTRAIPGARRVLAVDDSPTYLEEVSAALQEDGYEVIRARSGDEALALMAVDPVDCIVLDLSMPGLSGTETCARIKQSPGLRRIPVLVLTGMDGQDVMVSAINAGADDFVSKGEPFAVLRARVRAQLRRKQFEDEGRRVRDELLRRDAETDAARQVAEAQRALLDQLAQKNQELSRSMADLERLNTELEAFSYSVSHDLRQPLRNIAGFSGALMNEEGQKIGAQGRHYLGRINAGVERMQALIDGMLALAKVSRRSLTRVPCRLDDVALKVMQRLRESDPTRAVECDVTSGIEVLVDPALLESVLENLLGNAWKFTAKVEKPRIEVMGKHDESRSETICSVRDNGAGFEMAYAEKLFTPFQRLHRATEFDGLGIGLATVQRIVHRHGGRIWAESKPGMGATFSFTVPRSAT